MGFILYIIHDGYPSFPAKDTKDPFCFWECAIITPSLHVSKCFINIYLALEPNVLLNIVFYVSIGGLSEDNKQVISDCIIKDFRGLISTAIVHPQFYSNVKVNHIDSSQGSWMIDSFSLETIRTSPFVVKSYLCQLIYKSHIYPALWARSPMMNQSMPHKIVNSANLRLYNCQRIHFSN